MIAVRGARQARRPWVVALCALFVGVVGAMVLAVSVPMLWGWRPVAVTSGSMGAAVAAGDVVVVDPLGAGDPLPRPGDVVEVADRQRSGHDYLHRVVARSATGELLTRGDANASVDPDPVSREDVQGVARLRVPWLGRVTAMHGGLPLLPVAVLLGLTLGLASGLTLGQARGRLGAWQARFRAAGLRLIGRHPRARRLTLGARRLVRPGEATWLLAVATVALCSLVLPAVLGSSAAVFTSTTATGANTLTAAASFATYDQTVLASSPSFYYRLEETPGTVNLADSTTNGNVGAYILASKGPVSRWLFDEGSGTTSVDKAASANRLSQSTGTVAWAAGQAGNALSLNGTASAGSMSSAYRSIDTSKSFTVVAWMYPTSSSGTYVGVSQSGTSGSAFSLEFTNGYFRFVRSSNDASPPTSTYVAQAVSTSPLNTWYGVAGVYDATAGSMTLYVDSGAGVTTSGLPALWKATGPTVVGRSQNAGAAANPFAGRIDDVTLFTYAMTQSEQLNLKYQYFYPGNEGLQQPGALVGASAGTYATSFDGVGAARAVYYNNPGPFTMELWFRTRSTTGGVIAGHNASSDGTSTTQTDRTVYLDSGGRISFFVNGTTIRSAAAYNDGNWHYLAASLGASGMRLEVDASSVSSATPTSGTNFGGFWVFGYTAMPAAATNAPSTAHLTGLVDEIAYYTSQLSSATTAAHYAANS